MINSSVGLRINHAIGPAFVKRGKASVLVPNDMRKSVVFIGIKVDGRFIPKATGFFVSLPEHSLSFSHIVTAEHVISGLLGQGHEIWLRTNNKDGGVIESNFGTDGWYFHPGDEELSDVAVRLTAIEPNEDALTIGLGGSQNSFLLTPEVMSEARIGTGDEVAIIGLFRSHFGAEKNIPIVRVGNISAMDEEPVFTQYCGHTRAYLVEARSINGLSGSPVFVHLAPMRVVDGKLHQAEYSQFYLLGLMHGHFDVENVSEDLVVDDIGGRAVGINTGIGVVIPAYKIIEALNCDELREMRLKLSEHKRAQDAAIADGAPEASPLA